MVSINNRFENEQFFIVPKIFFLANSYGNACRNNTYQRSVHVFFVVLLVL